jgi:hypothetical protein
VWGQGGKERGVVGVGALNSRGVLYGDKVKGVVVESDTAYGARVKVEDEMCEFGCVGLV